MKASDFVSSTGERNETLSNLIQTEATDAVNTGLVGKSDKSEKALKGDLYEVGKRTGGAKSAALAAVTRNKKTDAADAASTEGERIKKRANAAKSPLTHQMLSRRNLRKSLRRGAQAKVLNKALEDTDFEGADRVVYKGHAAVKTAGAVKQKLSSSSKDALEKNDSLGALSEKKYRKEATDKKLLQRKMQFSRYFQRNVYENASEGVVKKKSLALAGSMKGALAAAAGALSNLLPAILVIILIMSVLTGIFGGAADEANKPSIDGLNDVEAEVATTLSGYGFTNEAIAAVLGNMKQEDGVNPNLDTDDGYGTMSLGIVQMTGSERINFKSWCRETGKAWNSATSQCEWIFSGEQSGYFAGRWSASWAASSYYELETGYEARFRTDFYRDGESFKKASDVDLATYSWMAAYERPGSRKSYGDDVSRLNKRLEYAHDYLSILSSGGGLVPGGGQDYMSAEQWQKNIADAAKRTPNAGAGYCATWTSNVYENAGLTRPGGNGNTQLGNQGTGANYSSKRATTDLSQIKVGMLVSAQFGSDSPAGNKYGHVGVYIGDGKVMDCIGYVRTISLTDWVRENGRGWVVCGYPWDWR